MKKKTYEKIYKVINFLPFCLKWRINGFLVRKLPPSTAGSQPLTEAEEQEISEIFDLLDDEED